MARVNIYIPTDLQAKMSALSKLINWSRVAQAAFEQEIKRAEARLAKGQKMVPKA